MCVSVYVCVLHTLSHRYCMCPEAIEKMRQMDGMEPAPVLTTHQLLHTVELVHNESEQNQVAVFLSCCSL